MSDRFEDELELEDARDALARGAADAGLSDGDDASGAGGSDGGSCNGLAGRCEDGPDISQDTQIRSESSRARYRSVAGERKRAEKTQGKLETETRASTAAVVQGEDESRWTSTPEKDEINP